MTKVNVTRYLAGAFVTACFSHAYAAQVDMYTPGGVNPSSYQVNGAGEIYSIYSNLTSADNAALVEPSANGGTELIFLGLHTPFDASSGFVESNAVEVNVFNDTLGDVATGGVSLVLSAAAAVDWTINIEAGVQLNSIYVFTRNGTSLAGTSINAVSYTHLTLPTNA